LVNLYHNGLKNFGERMYIKEAIKMRCCMFVLMVLMVSLVSAQTLEERFERAYRDATREAQKSSWALRIIAVALAEAGQFDRAIQITQKIEDAEVRSLALSEIAAELAKAGQFNRANQIFNLAIQIAQKSACSSALAEIAKVLIKVG